MGILPDAYTECFALVNYLQPKYPHYKVLALGRPSPRFALVEGELGLYVVDMQTGGSLTDFPIDNCRADYNGAGFAIFKEGKSAFYSPLGKRLTDFRIGDFGWRWSIKNILSPGQIVIDWATGRQFYNDGSELDPMDYED